MKADAKPKRAAVLISGGGTNLQSFIDAANAHSIHLELAAVISNVVDAGGLERARKAGIACGCIAHRDYASREAFEQALLESLDLVKPDIIILAGFMRILGPAFVRRYAGCILNIHPSLLPAYPGLNTHQRALDNGDVWHGCTVHFVTEELDGGPLIVQGRVPILQDDTAASLAQRVLKLEHRIYPFAADLLARGRLSCNEGKVLLDGHELTEPMSFGVDHKTQVRPLAT